MSRQLIEVPELERDVAIYLAGLIDGEGCFWISRGTKHNSKYTKIYYTPEFKIVLTDEPTIAWVADVLGCTYNFQKANKGKNHKPTYEVRMSKVDNLIAFIPQLIPHLKVKRAVAVLLLEFCESRRQERMERYHAKYTNNEMGVFDKIKRLNRVGILGGKVG